MNLLAARRLAPVPRSSPRLQEWQAMARCTAYESAKRVNRVADLIVQGARPSQIARFCAETWGLGERQAQTLSKKARARLVEDLAIERHEFLAARLQTLDEVILKALRAEQYANVIGAVRLQAELAGLGWNNVPASYRTQLNQANR